MAKRQGGVTYIFSVGMRNQKTRGTFEVKGLPAKAAAEVVGEGRTVAVSGGSLDDAFEPYAVHIYKIAGTG
jgi:hypothetical protein